jgi:hypothetical protein
MVFESNGQIPRPPRRSANDSDSSDSENFEEASNQIEMQSQEVLDGERLDRLVSEYYANFNEQFKQMSVKQRTSYFVRCIYI